MSTPARRGRGKPPLPPGQRRVRLPATTVAPETVERLRAMVERGDADSLGRAVDLVVDLYRERGGQ